MAYSTIAQFRANVSVGTVASITDAIVTDRIALADNVVKTDLAEVTDFDLIVVTPTFISLLAQYKTAELCLVYMYGRKRKVDENTDVDYWMGEYNKLVEKVLAGDIPLEDGSSPAVSLALNKSTFSNTARDNTEPALGQDVWGEHVTKSELEDLRPVV